MGREPTNGVHLGPQVQCLPVNADLRHSIDELTTERTGRLKPRDHDVTLGSLQVLQEVMQDSTAIAHAAAGNDERSGPNGVDLARLLRRLAQT